MGGIWFYLFFALLPLELRAFYQASPPYLEVELLQKLEHIEPPVSLRLTYCRRHSQCLPPTHNELLPMKLDGVDVLRRLNSTLKFQP